MSAFLRACSTELAAALFDGSIVAEVDLVTLFDADGSVLMRRTSFDKALPFDGETYAAGDPWIECEGWEVVNTMSVPTTTLVLRGANGAFQGGPSLRAQVNQGLLDGGSVLLAQAYLVRGVAGRLEVLDAIEVFRGRTAGIDLTGVDIRLAAKGRSNDLDQYAPRNMHQTTCNHAFCNAGCTLDRADFTAGYTMGGTPTKTLIPWVSAPLNPTRYQGGTLVVTSGANTGARRAIAKADGTGLTLAYPLRLAPTTADTFTAFEGCDKSYNSGSAQSCTARANTQHFRGYEFIPPPTTAV